MPHALLEFSPTPITQAVTVVYSIKVHAPVVKFTVSTVLVPCCGLCPCHCGVSLKSSTMVLNTFSVASHTTGLFTVRGCAVTADTANNASIVKNFFIWYLSTSPIFFALDFLALQDPFRASASGARNKVFRPLHRAIYSMNDNTITRSNGSRYEYDADFDVYRRVPEPHELTHMGQYGWIYICVFVLAFGAVMTLGR